MNLIDAIAAEYKQETATTRKALERVPDAKLNWKPHETSMTFGRLASHIAETQGWTRSIIEQDEFNITPDYKGFEGKTTADIVKQFDKNIADALRAMKKGVSNEA